MKELPSEDELDDSLGSLLERLESTPEAQKILDPRTCGNLDFFEDCGIDVERYILRYETIRGNRFNPLKENSDWSRIYSSTYQQLTDKYGNPC